MSAARTIKALKRGIGQLVVLKECFERASIATMIEIDFGQSGSIERRGAFRGSRFQEIRFVHKQELRIAVYETLDQPGTRYAVDLHVLTGDPFHAAYRTS
jgi:hypothetical protein